MSSVCVRLFVMIQCEVSASYAHVAQTSAEQDKGLSSCPPFSPSSSSSPSSGENISCGIENIQKRREEKRREDIEGSPKKTWQV